MAKYSGEIEQDKPISLLLTVGSSKSAGDVLALSDMVVYLQTASDANNQATVTIPCRFAERISVKALDLNGAGSAVIVGDKLAVDGSDITKATDGKYFGYALEAINSGATAVILVGFGL